MDYIRISQRSTVNGQQSLSISDVKELLRDWIKLYPNSFAPDVDFKIYRLEDGDIIIQLHDDLSSMAVALLVIYFMSTVNGQRSTDYVEAYITIDDTEVLLKQNIGKRAKLFCSQQATDNRQQSLSTVRFLLEDNYVLDYDFERKPLPVKDSGLQFEEPELTLPDEYETVVVGDVVKKEIDKVLEDEGLTPKKLLLYLICGAIGLAIGFLIVYLTGK